jgi:hypothetical protein
MIVNKIKRVLSCLFFALPLLTGGVAAAQELAPRAYWPAPVGTNVAIVAYRKRSVINAFH